MHDAFLGREMGSEGEGLFLVGFGGNLQHCFNLSLTPDLSLKIIYLVNVLLES